MIPAIVRSSILLLLALLGASVLRRQSAATRHAVLTAGLFSSLAVTFLGGLVPEFELTGARNVYDHIHDQTEILWSSEPRIAAVASSVTPPVVAPGHLLLWTWVAGMFIAGTVLVVGGVRIASVVLGSEPFVHARWLAALNETALRLHLRRRVRLLQNRRSVLGTSGLIRPKILLPRDADEWPDERIGIVLTHELAHVKRLDWPVQVMAELARAVYWFNPLFWIACRWLRSESEHACDDVVLNSGIDARDYAAHLLDLARSAKNAGEEWSPVLAMARPPHLERRFVAMLNPSLNRHSIKPARRFVIWAVALSITLPLAALRAASETKSVAPISSAPAVRAAPSVKVIAPTAPKPAVRASRASAPAPTAPPQGLADGSLSGTVSDSSGAVVPGVTLTVSGVEISQSGGVRETPLGTTVTDEVGRYEFRALTPGRYAIKAELPGFASYRKNQIEIRSSQNSRENIFLSVGSIVQRVEVMSNGQPRPPAPPVGPQRIRVGGNVIAANLISQVKPVYPQNAREAGVVGTVHLQGIIGTEGNFIALRVVNRNDPDLANAALEAVKQWRYRPTLLNNEPIEVQTEIEVEFKLVQ